MLHFLLLENRLPVWHLTADASVIPVALDAVLCALFACLLLQVGLSDLRTLTIPDRLNGAILALGCVRRAVLAIGVSVSARPDGFAGTIASGTEITAPGGPMDLLLQTAGGLLAAALPLYLLAAVVPGSIGGGDIKLAGAAGVFLGAADVLTGTGTGLVAGGIYAAGILITGLFRRRGTQRSRRFPLGPFLATGYVLALLQ